MVLQVGKNLIETSKELEHLPRELIDFAIANRSTNGDYYWSQSWGNLGGPYYRLDRILIIDRTWSWSENTRALSIRFDFSLPLRYRAPKSLSIKEKDNWCYEYGQLQYGNYYVNLAEGKDIYEKIVEMNLNETFPIFLNDYIEHWN